MEENDIKKAPQHGEPINKTYDNILNENDQKIKPFFVKHYRFKKDDSIPKIKCLVDGIIPEKSIGICYGESGIGKSYLTDYLQLCFATGRPFLGHDVKMCNVLSLNGESDINETKQRINALILAYGEPQKRIDWQVITYDLFEKANKTRIKQLKNLSLTEEEYFMLSGTEQLIYNTLKNKLKPKIIILDTLIDYLGMGDENNNTQIGAYFRNLKIIMDYFNCAILLNHHTTKADKEELRGAYNIRGYVNYLLFLSKAENGELTLTCTKTREFNKQTIHFNKVIIDSIDLILKSGDKVQKGYIKELDKTNWNDNDKIEKVKREENYFIDACVFYGKNYISGNEFFEYLKTHYKTKDNQPISEKTLKDYAYKGGLYKTFCISGITTKITEKQGKKLKGGDVEFYLKDRGITDFIERYRKTYKTEPPTTEEPSDKTLKEIFGDAILD